MIVVVVLSIIYSAIYLIMAIMYVKADKIRRKQDDVLRRLADRIALKDDVPFSVEELIKEIKEVEE